MGRKNGPWTVEESALKYKNEFIEVHEDKVTRPDGKPGSYATVTVKPGISVIAVDDAGDAYLTRQFRYVLGAESVEAICGAVEEDESPLEAARREAREEAGILADDWQEIGYVDLDTSIFSCRSTLFLARRLKLTEPSPEGVETLSVVKVPLAEAVRMVMDGRITHSPSCALILKAHLMLNEGVGL
ncbi:MAG TPA: NUDIX hydrolase [Pyrinomonadaceae bacterium]|jgi:8-oxo-dGTP pyrophosphatase MutT (NUDIX family)|nr:NUDIX hydrolase [Pyrinomonadaceae bacterium]